MGWCTSQTAAEDSLIKNTEDSEWIYDWSETHRNQYDIQLYAKWEKEDPCAKGHKPQKIVTQATAGKDAKTVNVSKNKTTSKTISKLKAKKKYYVRIRSYKTVKVNGKSAKLYSSWSKVRNVKMK